MFNKDFFPTPPDVIETMLDGVLLEGKTVLEPSAGKGNIVDFLQRKGAEVIACEKNPDLQKIVASKCKLISSDFLTVISSDVSHIDLIIMNPPFSEDAKHIQHAFNIAPAGCKIISLANLSTLVNTYSRLRGEIAALIENYGRWENLGDCFTQAERKTGVEVGMVVLNKPGKNYQSEFEGFFTEEEQEEHANGIMPYNFVRDLVNRYVGAVKIYDEQLEAGVRMNELTTGFFSGAHSIDCTQEGKPKLRNEFKKDLQKTAWKFIFKKMNMEKYTTKGLQDDINKFVEQQQGIPFTMRNIYKMVEVVIGTQSQRMDRALLEVFDKLTQHYHDNRYNVEGWKTNSHYLINQKFILGWCVEPSYSSGMTVKYSGNGEIVDDMQKALCYITGTDYATCDPLWSFFHQKGKIYEWNTWYTWGFFEIKGFKKGSMHFKFKSIDVWAEFNQHIARIKGYPLFEGVKRKEAV